jgi:hypothetical protein
MSAEAHLVRDAACRIRRAANIKLMTEVPLLGRVVDLIYLDSLSVYTVEFKLRDWSRALLQARDHLLGADFAWVCLPVLPKSPTFLSEARVQGIGVALYVKGRGWPFQTIVPPVQSPSVWQPARLALVRHLEQACSRQQKAGVQNARELKRS